MLVGIMLVGIMLVGTMLVGIVMVGASKLSYIGPRHWAQHGVG